LTVPNATTTWPIFAGAGNCDTTKGVEVGVVFVSVETNGNTTVDLVLVPGSILSLTQVHMHFGYECGKMLPVHEKSDEWLAAPGEFSGQLDMVSLPSSNFSHTEVYTESSPPGVVFVTIHANVCGLRCAGYDDSESSTHGDDDDDDDRRRRRLLTLNHPTTTPPSSGNGNCYVSQDTSDK
jgi:hypothetical protein